MRQLLILADDLSGAADCANACMASGLTAAVTFNETDQDRLEDVLSVDCDTRPLEPDQAGSRVALIMRAYDGPHSDVLLVKKVDSALRGNVGAEIASVLAERRAADGARIVAVVAPAFPSCGRTTLDGYQLAHGRPLHETEIWKHNRVPGTAHIPSLLAQAGLNATSLGLNQIRAGVDSLRSTMEHAAVSADVLVCDAVTEEDLHDIATGSLTLGRKTVWAGAAALAHHLTCAAGLIGKASPVQISSLCDGPTLFVIGSMSGASHEQATVLARKGAVNPIELAQQTLLAGPRSPQWTQIAAAIEASLRAGRDTLVQLELGEWIDPQKSRLLTDALGTMLSPHRELVGALVASGGETARAVLTGWGVAFLRLIAEVESGLPFSVAEFPGHALPVLTKAGSFGMPETLLHCRDFLGSLDRSAGGVTGYAARRP